MEALDKENGNAIVERASDIKNYDWREIEDVTDSVLNATKTCNQATEELRYLNDALSQYDRTKMLYDIALDQVKSKIKKFKYEL